MTTTVDEQVLARSAAAALGEWVADLKWTHVPADAQDRLQLVLLDSLGVTVLGAGQPEQRALVEAWRPRPGPSALFGTGRTTTVEAAAWLNASALVRLELDEGHKLAKGHPSAHALPAVLALAGDLGSSGADTAAALMAAYEIAARFGRATSLRAGAHPHGSWGVAAAAAGCARLLGLSAEQIAAAVDTGAGLPIAGHFASALDGNPVRDAWMAASNASGLAAARMAAAGVARNTGTAATSLGGLLGTFDPAALVEGLGTRWDVRHGYFKRHASCSFTHPVADAVLAMRPSLPEDSADIDEVLVETHSLGAGLARRTWDSRLAALFSIPFVVAAAVVHGHVRPDVSSRSGLVDARVVALATRVSVRRAGDLDARLPNERAARVTIRTGGSELVVEVPNPVGDAAHQPLTEDGIVALLTDWLGDPPTVTALRDVAGRLPDVPDVRPLLQRLA